MVVLRLIGFLQDHVDAFVQYFKKSVYIGIVKNFDAVFDRKLEAAGHGMEIGNHDGVFDYLPSKNVVKSYKPFLDHENSIKSVEPLFSEED